jgi:hypothetical protein
MIAVGLRSFSAERKSPTGGMLVGIGQLLRRQAFARLDHQALGVDQPAALARLGLVYALGHHGRHDQIGDAGRRFAGAEEEEGLVGQCRCP